MWRLILLTGIFINGILFTCGGKAKGKTVFMDWEKFVDCPGFVNKDIITNNMSVFRGDVTALSLQGSLIVETDIITPPLKLTLAINRQMPGGGSYRMLAYDVGNFCDKILQKGSPWESYVRAMKPLPPERCPIYKQVYNVDGVQNDLNNLPLTKEMVGKYIAILELYRPMGEPTIPGFSTPLTKFMCMSLHFIIDTE